MSGPLIALIDVGKTHTRLSCVEARSGTQIWSDRRANAVVQTSLGRELDVVAIERWLIEAFRTAPARERIAVIVPVAHGAAAVLVDNDGIALAAPDYEDPCFESVSVEYERSRDPFERTCSPSLPLGLNLARQWFYLERRQPQLFARVTHFLLYPQYWAWRFSGVMASEVTSLGCHSDLWRPQELSFSALARTHNWTKALPATRFAGDRLGRITSQMAAATGLDPQCEVVCGIHDSNASYLKFLIGRPRDAPFTVISSGTWTVVMANRGELAKLQEQRDMLANVDAFGSPVATARFMGGREYEAIAGVGGALADGRALPSVLSRQAIAVPAFAAGGPYARHEGRLLRADPLTATERAALATLYLSLMSELLIESLGAAGDVLVDGPLASNPLFGSLLATCMPTRAVWLNSGPGGGARSAAYLAGFEELPQPPLQLAPPLQLPGFDDYRRNWRELLPA